MADVASQFLITIGGILLLGLLTSALGQRTPLPRVTLLLLFGVAIGESGLNLIPELFTRYFEVVAAMTLVMVGFLLGGKLSAETFRFSARKILLISLSAALVSVLLVALGLLAIGAGLELAILLGSIAAATAPAAVLDVVVESGRGGRFGELLLAIVAVDDAWGLVLFSIGLAVVLALRATGTDVSPLLFAGQEVGGAVLLGAALGFPAAFLTGRMRPGQPMLTEAVGLVFLCGGLAIWLEVSFLIAPMVMGAVITHFARHHEYPFHAIEGIEWPFLAIMFVLAGATLELDALAALGLLGATYSVCRTAGKILGGYLGGALSGARPATRRWIGLALLPHAGVEIGMALVAANAFLDHAQTLLSVVVAATVIFELVGPVLTRLALVRAQRSART